jgi:hypothetical protein
VNNYDGGDVAECSVVVSLSHSAFSECTKLHSVLQVLEAIAPPYTPEFVQLFLPMVENEEITGTMRGDGENDLVSEFIGKNAIAKTHCDCPFISNNIETSLIKHCILCQGIVILAKNSLFQGAIYSRVYINFYTCSNPLTDFD